MFYVGAKPRITKKNTLASVIIILRAQDSFVKNVASIAIGYDIIHHLKGKRLNAK